MFMINIVTPCTALYELKAFYFITCIVCWLTLVVIFLSRGSEGVQGVRGSWQRRHHSYTRPADPGGGIRGAVRHARSRWPVGGSSTSHLRTENSISRELDHTFVLNCNIWICFWFRLLFLLGLGKVSLRNERLLKYIDCVILIQICMFYWIVYGFCNTSSLLIVLTFYYHKNN